MAAFSYMAFKILRRSKVFARRIGNRERINSISVSEGEELVRGLSNHSDPLVPGLRLIGNPATMSELVGGHDSRVVPF